MKNPLTKAKKAGANLQEPEKASIARERKLQCNPPDKKRNNRGTFSVQIYSSENTYI